jgi:LytS/YehU family sensor histidine kinase
MMLLPLIDHAIVRGLEPAGGTGAIRIRSEASGGRLRLTIVDSGVGLAPEAGGDGITVIRERLEALYGGDARLDLRRVQDRATQAVLDLPLEACRPLEAPASGSAYECFDPARRGPAPAGSTGSGP